MLSKKKTSQKLLRQLASKNVKKSAEDYLVYFFTLTFAVCLFYTFNSIEAQFRALNLPDTYNFLEAAKSVMAGCSAIVCLIIGFLVVYSNSFLMKRRKREFAIYGILGMEQKDISRLLARETIRIGGISLLCGLPLGVAVSQILAMVTARMANGNVGNYTFVFSAEAMAAAVIFFVLTFAVVHIFRLWELRKMKLIDLLLAEQKNEGMPEKGNAWGILFIFALLLTGAGYWVIYTWRNVDFLKTAAVFSALVAAGTLLFFLSAAPVLLKVLKKKKGFYYRNLNLFVVNQLGSSMKKEGFSLAAVCILMYFSVSVMGIGTGMGQSFISEKSKMVPYDLSVIYYYDGIGTNEEMIKNGSIKEALEKQNAETADYLGKTGELTFYEDDNFTSRQLFGQFETKSRLQIPLTGEMPIDMVGVDDYNEIRALQGKPPVVLGETEYALTYSEPSVEEMLKNYMEQGGPLTVSGTELSLKKDGLYRQTLYNRNAYLDFGTLIVPQKIAEKHRPFMRVMDAVLLGEKEGCYDAMHRDEMLLSGFLFQGREDLFIDFLSGQLMVSYLGIYLGITFLITAGAVLALQQLTQATDNEKRFALLYKLGAGSGTMRKALKAQLGFYFGLPFLVAAFHSGVTMYGVYQGIPYLSAWDISRNVLFASGLAVAMYSIYFITTYAGCKRILKL
ncbi:ABC transporter permease [[Clostridium] symbiosum]|uniref:FtsX-like permease family protein n=1 Tax=Clostridium symbiosum TaxID=1512 RepID=UPI001D05D2F3|nr:ABC transporter permease [[Clostridium] symbiosum]MCB6607234.1 ABC transporter permease [[Clostridium] symbiosum]MCB6929794.1 ABC transporter permease [[Clostridium] symbiosum]